MVPFWRENEKIKFNTDYQDIKFITFEESFQEPTDYSKETIPKLVPYVPDEVACSLPFFMTVAGHFHVGERHFTERKGRLGYQCILTTGGNVIIELADGTTMECKKGDVLILECMPFHRYYPGDMGYWEYKHFHFCAPSGPSLPEQTLGVTESNARISGLIDKIFQEATRNTALSSYIISDAISGILTSIVVTRNQQITHQPHQEKLEAAAAYLRENYGTQINIDHIARDVYLSRYYFIRLFKNYFGVSPYGYLTAYRINQAKEQLMLNVTMDEIAQNCGFGNANNLNRIFKKHVGVTPSDFRKKHLSNYQK